jgi:hypothetical protein
VVDGVRPVTLNIKTLVPVYVVSGVVGVVVVPYKMEKVGSGTPVTPPESKFTVILVLVAPEELGTGGAGLGATGALRLLMIGTLVGQPVAGLG